jgi:hypothetical protein
MNRHRPARQRVDSVRRVPPTARPHIPRLGRGAPIAAHAALFVFVWGRLSRMGVRFERLFARWRAGTLPALWPIGS